MRLLEYEAKGLLSSYGAPVPTGHVVSDAAESTRLSYPVVMKVQIPTGGRGKAGGVRQIYTNGEFHDAARELLSQPILGYRSNTLLIEEALEIKRELYLAITIDRAARNLVLMAHREGGVDIEEASRRSEMLKIPLPDKPDDTVQQKVLEYFNLTENFRLPLASLVKTLWEACTHEDALLIEINPLVVTQHDRLVCADAKIELDDAAMFRHRWDFEQKPESTQFVVLHREGTIGAMANGAGLAMATVDAIQSAGATPANFLDIGGGADVNGMVKAFQDLSTLPNIRAIVVNIFGGITRCDEVAEAIVAAHETVENLPRLFIRLAGTNEAEGKAILENAGIPTLLDLKSCVQDAVVEAS